MENKGLEVNQQDYDRIVVKLAVIFESYGFSTQESAQMAVEALRSIEPKKTPRKSIFLK